MGYRPGPPTFRPRPSNPAAAAAAARSVQAHRVYVGNLPYGVGWGELKDFMREAGDVSFAEVLMGPDGRSKGCGVVEFTTAEAAHKAIAELSDKPLLGRPVFIREDRETQARYGHQSQRAPAINGSGRGSSSQLFVSGLALTVTWRTLKDMFRQAGNVLHADVVAGKGIGTVLMSTENEATAAIATFNGSTVEGSRILVREDRYANSNQGGGAPQPQISRPKPGEGFGMNGDSNLQSNWPTTTVDPATQQPSTQIFVGNLPYTTDSAALMALCPPGVTHCEVMSIGQRSKGMGVVEFSSLEAAAEAIAALQYQEVGGRPLKVKYNERWHDFTEQAVNTTT